MSPTTMDTTTDLTTKDTMTKHTTTTNATARNQTPAAVVPHAAALDMPEAVPAGGTVYIIDDDPGMRRSIAFVLESEGLHTQPYASAEEFLREFTPEIAGCAILDLLMPGMSGQELLETLHLRNAELPVIILTGHGDVPAAVRALKVGAVDFLQKPVDPATLVRRVREIMHSDAMRRRARAVAAEATKRFASLTPRERQLLALLVEGKSNKEVAGVLGIAVKTVAHHRAHLMTKVQAVNAADLVRLWFEAGQGRE